MTPLASRWMVFGESGVPLWLVLLGLIAALIVAHRWLRVERERRKGWMARCLPWTLTGTLVLLAWIVWRPVFVLVRTWDQPGRIVAVVDTSESMSASVGGQDLTSQLDLLALWHPDVGAGRNLAAARVIAQLAASRETMEQHRDRWQRAEAQAAQGLPDSQAETAALEDSRTWARTFQDHLIQDFSAVHDTLASLGSEPEETRTKMTAGLDAYESRLQALSRSLESAGSGQAPSRGGDAAVWQALLDAEPRVTECLYGIQSLADAAYARQHAARLAPWLAEVSRRSRAEASSTLARLLPPEVTLIEPDDGDPRETDSYQSLERALARHEGSFVSHLVLLSDGGHNGGPAGALAERCRNEGIALMAVGVGVPPSTHEDFAVLDWRAPRVVRSERTVTLPVQVKTPAGVRKPFVLRLTEGETEAARGEWTSDGREQMAVSLPWKTPLPGRHAMRLAVESPADSDPGNNAMGFVVDVIAKPAELLLVDSCPDWDTAYLGQAANRLGMNLSQVFTEGKPPRRGAFSGAVPNSAEQWKRLQAVLLRGPVFPGLAGKDVEDLGRFVLEGGTLVIMPEETGGYQKALAPVFGWATNTAAVAGKVRLGPEARHYPLLKLGTDGAQSARLFEALGTSEHVFGVPPQHLVLAESERGEAVCSVGFYGRGRVVFWGLEGLYRMREYSHAGQVNRLLESLLGDWVAPLAPAGADATLVFYPPLPVAGVASRVLAPDSGALTAAVTGRPEPLPLAPGLSNRVGRLTAPHSSLIVSFEGRSFTNAVADNPGMERLYPEFGEAFLKQLARDTDGRYLRAPEALESLKSIQPRTSKTAASAVYPLGRHPAVLVALVLLATAHWVFRKLSGMAI